MFDLEKLFEHVDIAHVWMFITDRCNLNCDYCFFRGRTNRITISFNKLKRLFGKLSRKKKYCFVVSGGEPLIEWPLVADIFQYLRENFPDESLVLQTNGIFLDEAMILFLKNNKVVIEHGIDGEFSSTSKHRKGTLRKEFERVVDSIKIAVSQGVKLNPTMAVTPSEIKYMYENFLYLISLGIESMDVHPTLLDSWEKRHVFLFEREYFKLINYEIKNRKGIICKDYYIPRTFGFDLVIMPDGNVLPNWVYLMLPRQLKKHFFFMKLEESPMLNEERLKYYLNLYYKFYKIPNVTYRDFSNFNVEIMLKKWKNKEVYRHFLHYKRLSKIITKIDQNSLLK